MTASPSPRKQTAIVTGGGQGIGRAIAGRLLIDGWAVLIAEADSQAGQEAVQILQPLGDVSWQLCDVAQEGDVKALMDQAGREWGLLGALICNAGMFEPRPLRKTGLDDWNRIIGANLTGAFLCAKYAEDLLRAGRGSIVTIGSTRAHQSEPDTEPYAASKGGLVALTHALAISLGPDIRANCISPGWIDVSGPWKKNAPPPDDLSPQDHAQHPAGRVGRPEDVAALAAWLCGTEAGFVTGAEFIIDGGMTRKMVYV